MKLLKKGALVGLLTASFLLTGLPHSTDAQNTYLINSSVNVYLTAEDAINMENPVKTYSPGTYFIYKTADGMINMSPYANGAGGWINPSEAGGSYVESEDEETTSSEVAKDLDKEQINDEEKSTSKIEETTKEATIEKEETTKEVSTTPVQTITLDSEVNKYVDSYKALAGEKTSLTYGPGSYYVYKTFNGMYNITRNPGEPGAWVNLGNKIDFEETVTTQEKVKPEVTKPQGTKTTVAKEEAKETTASNIETYTLNKTMYTYSNSYDALKMENPKGSYAPGTYYVYKSFNGMYNISSTKGAKGAWVNPSSTVGSPIVTKPTTPTKTTTASTKTTTTTPKTTTSSLKVGSTYTVNYFTPVYGTVTKAKNRVGAHEGYSKGTYYIVDMKDGMLKLSETKGGSGLWLNPNQNVASSTPSNGTSITDKAKEYLGEDGYDFYTWYGYNYRAEWCAMFVSWLGNHTGNAGIIPTFDYVDDFVDYYKDRKSMTVASDFKPQKDMLVMFDWNRNGYGDHIGMVTGADDDYVYTIEGNYNDEVSEAKYRLDDADILGYALPAYPGASVAGQIVKNGAFLKKLNN